MLRIIFTTANLSLHTHHFLYTLTKPEFGIEDYHHTNSIPSSFIFVSDFLFNECEEYLYRSGDLSQYSALMSFICHPWASSQILGDTRGLMSALCWSSQKSTSYTPSCPNRSEGVYMRPTLTLIMSGEAEGSLPYMRTFLAFPREELIWMGRLKVKHFISREVKDVAWPVSYFRIWFF